MLSRVWVERAGSESAVFGGARPLSDLVDMPIDTCICLWICCAMLRYACAWLPFSLSLFPSRPLSLSLSLRLLTCGPPCSSILLISPQVTLGFFVPSFSPSHVISPASLRLAFVLNFFLLLQRPSRFRRQFSLSFSLEPVTVCWLENARLENDSGGDGCGGGCALMLAWWGCGGGGRWQTGETRRQGMTVVECRG